jgi:hypothetical protein
MLTILIVAFFAFAVGSVAGAALAFQELRD